MRRPLLGATIALTTVLVLFGGFLTLAWRFRFLELTFAHGAAQPVAAAITLVGVFLTAVASTLGILLKYSTDLRAEQRLRSEYKHNKTLQEQAAERIRIDANRNIIMQRDTEHRLKLEAATAVVKLLTTNDGQLAPHLQLAGALFTLANLGEYELTVALLSELLPQSQIEPGYSRALAQ